jgi:hypothetical protein
VIEAIGVALGAVLTLSVILLWGFAVLIYARFTTPRTTSGLALLAIMTVAAFAAAAIWWGAFFDALEMNTILTILWYAGILIVVSPFVLSLLLNRGSGYSEAKRD